MACLQSVQCRSNQTWWYNKRISRKGYSVPRDFKIENYKLNKRKLVPTFKSPPKVVLFNCFREKFEKTS